MNFIRDSVSDVFNDFLGLCFPQNVGHIQINHIVLIQMLSIRRILCYQISGKQFLRITRFIIIRTQRLGGIGLICAAG